jgi:hypothetical protein
MRRMVLAGFVLAAGACVDVPDGVRAQFAAAGAAERSNFRPGRHGTASPLEDPPAPKAAETAVTGATIDAGAAASEPGSDGGAS